MNQKLLATVILVSALIVGITLAFLYEPSTKTRETEKNKGYTVQVNDPIIINGKSYRLVLIRYGYETTPQLILE